jgi:hypothetical protein
MLAFRQPSIDVEQSKVNHRSKTQDEGFKGLLRRLLPMFASARNSSRLDYDTTRVHLRPVMLADGVIAQA